MIENCHGGDFNFFSYAHWGANNESVFSDQNIFWGHPFSGEKRGEKVYFHVSLGRRAFYRKLFKGLMYKSKCSSKKVSCAFLLLTTLTKLLTGEVEVLTKKEVFCFVYVSENAWIIEYRIHASHVEFNTWFFEAYAVLQILRVSKIQGCPPWKSPICNIRYEFFTAIKKLALL